MAALATPYPLTAWLAVGFLLLHTGLRPVLMAQSWHAAQFTLASAATVLGIGRVFDLVTLGLALPALLGVESLLGTRKQAGRIRRGLVLAVALLGPFALGFGVMAEWFFWDEFGVRFNFIAVDYLVYTHEVIGNIRESFPVGTLLSMLAVITLAARLSRRRPRVYRHLSKAGLFDARPAGDPESRPQGRRLEVERAAGNRGAGTAVQSDRHAGNRRLPEDRAARA